MKVPTTRRAYDKINTTLLLAILAFAVNTEHRLTALETKLTDKQQSQNTKQNTKQNTCATLKLEKLFLSPLAPVPVTEKRARPTRASGDQKGFCNELRRI